MNLPDIPQLYETPAADSELLFRLSLSVGAAMGRLDEEGISRLLAREEAPTSFKRPEDIIEARRRYIAHYLGIDVGQLSRLDIISVNALYYDSLPPKFAAEAPEV